MSGGDTAAAAADPCIVINANEGAGDDSPTISSSIAGVGKEAYNTVVLAGGINILVGRVAGAAVGSRATEGGDARVEDETDDEAPAKINGKVPFVPNDEAEAPGNMSKIILPTSTPPPTQLRRLLHQSPTVGRNDGEASEPCDDDANNGGGGGTIKLDNADVVVDNANDIDSDTSEPEDSLRAESGAEPFFFQYSTRISFDYFIP